MRGETHEMKAHPVLQHRWGYPTWSHDTADFIIEFDTKCKIKNPRLSYLGSFLKNVIIARLAYIRRRKAAKYHGKVTGREGEPHSLSSKAFKKYKKNC